MTEQRDPTTGVSSPPQTMTGPAPAEVPPGKEYLSVQDALDRALLLANQGKLQRAELLAREIVGARPKNADAHNVLGVVLHRQGRHGEAAKSAREAIRLNPGVANYYSNLGEMERQLKNLDAARTALERALVLDPKAIQALNNLGVIHFDAREFEKARACYEKALTLDPNYAEAHNNLGNVFRVLEGPERALLEYERAIEARESYAEAYNNMGTTLRDMDRPDEAELAFHRAIAIRPNYVEATNNLASLLIAQKRYDDVLRTLGDLLKLAPKDPKTLVNVARAQLLRASPLQAERAVKAVLADHPDQIDALNLYGQICHELDRYDESLKSFERVLALDPGNLEALNFYGVVLKSVGRLDDARATFIKALEIQPRALGAYSNVVDLEKFSPDNPLFVAMRQILERAKDPEHERFMATHFALGKAYEDMGEYETALKHYAIGARQKRAQLTYNQTETFQFFDEIRATFTREYFSNPPFEGRPSALPIFIIGMPRSGSTLTEQIISSHPNVFGAGEIKTLSASIGALRYKFPSLPKYPAMAKSMRPTQFAAIADAYLQSISAQAKDALRVTDKLLTNFFFVGLIHVLFPNAKIVHTIRNPVDCCLSSYTKLFKDDMPHSYDFGELGRYYGKYHALMAHWREVLPEGVMLDVPYEGVVRDPETKAREIIAFCGLDWDDRCLKFHESVRPVKTASVSQVRQPLYQSSVERWRRYGSGLDPLVDALRQSGVGIAS